MAGEYRVIIAGSRDMADYEAAKKAISEALGEIGGSAQVRVVSGHCRGADILGERYAREHGLELAVFPAEWNRYGRRAGVRRARHPQPGRLRVPCRLLSDEGFLLQ